MHFYSEDDGKSRMLACFTMFVGVFLFSFLIGSISTILTNNDIRGKAIARNIKKLVELRREYLFDKDLFLKARNAIKYGSLSSDDYQTFLSDLPFKLQMEISFEIYGKCLLEISFFAQKSRVFLSRIGPLLRSTIVEKGDFIYVTGEIAEEGKYPFIVWFLWLLCLNLTSIFSLLAFPFDFPLNFLFQTVSLCDLTVFFIKKGAIGFCESESEMKTLIYYKNGSIFGDIDIILFDSVRSYTARALKDSELLVLGKKQFNELFFHSFKKYGRQLKKDAEDRSDILETLLKIQKAKKVSDKIKKKEAIEKLKGKRRGTAVLPKITTKEILNSTNKRKNVAFDENSVPESHKKENCDVSSSSSSDSSPGQKENEKSPQESNGDSFDSLQEDMAYFGFDEDQPRHSVIQANLETEDLLARVRKAENKVDQVQATMKAMISFAAEQLDAKTKKKMIQLANGPPAKTAGKIIVMSNYNNNSLGRGRRSSVFSSTLEEEEETGTSRRNSMMKMGSQSFLKMKSEPYFKGTHEKVRRVSDNPGFRKEEPEEFGLRRGINLIKKEEHKRSSVCSMGLGSDEGVPKEETKKENPKSQEEPLKFEKKKPKEKENEEEFDKRPELE